MCRAGGTDYLLVRPENFFNEGIGLPPILQIFLKGVPKLLVRPRTPGNQVPPALHVIHYGNVDDPSLTAGYCSFTIHCKYFFVDFLTKIKGDLFFKISRQKLPCLIDLVRK